MAAAVAAAAAEPVGYAQRPLATWSVEEVCKWLTDVVQLPQHTEAFKEHGIDGEFSLLCACAVATCDSACCGHGLSVMVVDRRASVCVDI